MSNPITKAIFERLDGDSTLDGLAGGGVWHLEAEPGTLPPLVIFQKVSGTPRYSFGAGEPPAYDNDLWQVKGIGSASQAENIDLRCQELLNDYSLSIVGRYTHFLLRVSDIPTYAEDVDGEHYVHAGSYYRLITELTS